MKFFVFCLILISIVPSTYAQHKLEISEEEEDIYKRKDTNETIAPSNKLASDLKMVLPDSIFQLLVAMNVDQKMKFINDECKKIIDQINQAGVPDPIDHILFTFILVMIVYIPTKFIHSILDMVYGKAQISPN